MEEDNNTIEMRVRDPEGFQPEHQDDMYEDGFNRKFQIFVSRSRNPLLKIYNNSHKANRDIEQTHTNTDTGERRYHYALIQEAISYFEKKKSKITTYR